MAQAQLGGKISAGASGSYGFDAFSGAFVSLAGNLTGSMLGEVSNKYVQFGISTTSGGLSGGVGSSIAGGNFWDGARNGMISAGLNHGFHTLKRSFPSFKKLSDSYPKDNPDGTHAKPSKDGYVNQCAIRLGYAFIGAGEDISSYDNTNQTSEGYPRYSKGFAIWISKTYEPQPLKMSQKDFRKFYWNKQGIIYLEPAPGGIGHIDLFNNGSTNSGYYKADQVWFWPVK